MSINHDDLNILTEFDDPARKCLIDRINARYLKDDLVRRTCLFPLWFADIKILEWIADPTEDRAEEVKKRVKLTRESRLPSLCEFSVHRSNFKLR